MEKRNSSIERKDEANKILARLKEQAQQMSKDEIFAYAQKIRPLLRVYPHIPFSENDYELFWAYVPHIKTQEEKFIGKPLKIAEGLTMIGEITSYHQYRNKNIPGPSIDEVIVQCPKEWLDKVVAFEVKYSNVGCYNKELDCHMLRTIYYSGDLPEDIANRSVEW